MMLYLDIPAVARFPKQVLKYLPKTFGFSTFYQLDYWGNAESIIEKVLKAGHPFVKVGSVWRDDHNYGKSDLKQVIKAGHFCEKMQAKYPNQKVYFYPFIEHILKNPDTFFKQLPFQQGIINNPGEYNNKSGNFSDIYPDEVHKNFGGLADDGDWFSYDGNSITNFTKSQVKNEKKLRAAGFFGSWSHAFNMKKSDHDQTKRKDRTYIPTAADFKKVISLVKS